MKGFCFSFGESELDISPWAGKGKVQRKKIRKKFSDLLNRGGGGGSRRVVKN